MFAKLVEVRDVKTVAEWGALLDDQMVEHSEVFVVALLVATKEIWSVGWTGFQLERLMGDHLVA